MALVEKLKRHTRTLTYVFAFVFGAVLVQSLWAIEFHESSKRGSGNLALLSVNIFTKNIEKLNSKSPDEATSAVISTIGGKSQLIDSLKFVFERHQNDKIKDLIQALEALHLPKSQFNTQLRDFVHEEDGRRFTPEDANQMFELTESVELRKRLLNAETELIIMEINSKVGNGFKPSMTVWSMIPFVDVVEKFAN